MSKIRWLRPHPSDLEIPWQVDFCTGFGELELTPGSAAVISQNAGPVQDDQSTALRNSSGRIIREGNEEWMR